MVFKCKWNEHMKYVIMLLLVLLTGCATPDVWSRANTSFQEFKKDEAQCSAQGWSIPNASAFQIAMVEYKCMQGKGYMKVPAEKQK
jgi:hypothetical protein